MLSGHLSNLGDVAKEHQGFLFSEDPDDNPHTKITRFKRYPVALPMYPFRTLCPRELTLQKLTPGDFDVASPLLPGNTQLNITLKRRKPTNNNWHRYLLPENLNVMAGSLTAQLNEDQWNAARQFTLKAPTEADPAAVEVYNVLSVAITLSDVYLEVNTTTPPPLTKKPVHFNSYFLVKITQPLACKNHPTLSPYLIDLPWLTEFLISNLSSLNMDSLKQAQCGLLLLVRLIS